MRKERIDLSITGARAISYPFRRKMRSYLTPCTKINLKPIRLNYRQITLQLLKENIEILKNFKIGNIFLSLQSANHIF